MVLRRLTTTLHLCVSGHDLLLVSGFEGSEGLINLEPRVLRLLSQRWVSPATHCRPRSRRTPGSRLGIDGKGEGSISDEICPILTFKVAYYSFTGVQDVYTINKRKLNVVCINILITNKNPYMRPLLLKVKGARNGKTLYV